MDLILASNNKGKIIEIQSIVHKNIHVKSLKEIGINVDIEEPFNTFSENAFTKANYIFQQTGKAVMADDSGLVIEALNGAPGVLSARYSGMHGDDDANMAKVLNEIKNNKNRNAYFICVICFITDEGKPYYFEGRCNGDISFSPKGTNGFGYDPIFIPKGYEQTFAELDSNIKNKLSHRAKALAAFSAFVNQM